MLLHFMIARQTIRSPSCNKFKSVHEFSFQQVFCALGLFFDLCNCFQFLSVPKCLKVFCDLKECFVIFGCFVPVSRHTFAAQFNQ